MVKTNSKKMMMAGATGVAILALGCLAGFSSKTIQTTAADAVSRSITYSYGVNVPAAVGTAFDATAGITNKATNTRVRTTISKVGGDVSFENSGYYVVNNSSYYSNVNQGGINFSLQVMNISSFHIIYQVSAATTLASHAPYYLLYQNNDLTGTNSGALYFDTTPTAEECDHTITINSSSLGFAPNSVKICIPFYNGNTSGTVKITSLTVSWSC
jgi:hypothetical protein